MGLVLAVLICSGCDTGLALDKLNLQGEEEAVALVKVDIHFDSPEHIVCWVTDLGISANEDVYSGGSSRCYYYDEDGNIKGVFNYQRVTYIEKLE